MVKVSCSSVPTADSVETSAEDSFDCEAAGEAVDEEEFDCAHPVKDKVSSVPVRR